jgi:hypothetical protein
MVGLIIIGVLVLIVSYAWVKGISNMKEKHPDYKGEDFLNWDGKYPDWDDNKTHSEGDF